MQSSCFSKESGRRERVPGSPHASTRRWSESRGGQAPVTPLGDGGLRVPPPERTVSTARKFPATKTLSRQSLWSVRAHTHHNTTRTMSGTDSFSSVTQHARHAHAQVTRETHHMRFTTSHFFSSAGPPTFAPPLPPCCVVGSFVYVTVPLSAQSSSSSVARDVLWVRALGALPDELRSALCSAGLDDPRVLCEYPVEPSQKLEDIMGGKLETGRAPSGAASTSHSPFSSFDSSLLPTGPSGTGSSWTAGAGDTGTGGVPRTDQASSSNFLGMARGVEEKGGDPRTDHSLCSNSCVGADSRQSGGWQPKLPLLILLPALFSGFQLLSLMILKFAMNVRVLQKFLRIVMD